MVVDVALIWFRNGATFRGFLVSWHEKKKQSGELLVHFLRLLVLI